MHHCAMLSIETSAECRVPEARSMFGRLKASLTQAIDVVGYGFQVTADAFVIRLGSRIAEADNSDVEK